MKNIKLIICILLSFIIAPVQAAIILGNAKGSVTLVEVMSYSCAHCRAMAPIIESIEQKNPQLKIKLIPITSDENGLIATTSSYALAKQNLSLFKQYHHKLLTESLSTLQIENYLKSLPINHAQFEQDRHANWVLKEILLGINLLTVYQSGTPLFIVYPSNDPEYLQVFRGEVSIEQLQQAIKEAV